jgi:hypothetical protein
MKFACFALVQDPLFVQVWAVGTATWSSCGAVCVLLSPQCRARGAVRESGTPSRGLDQPRLGIAGTTVVFTDRTGSTRLHSVPSICGQQSVQLPSEEWNLPTNLASSERSARTIQDRCNNFTARLWARRPMSEGTLNNSVGQSIEHALGVNM